MKIPFLVGWTSILTQLFWCEQKRGTIGFDTLPFDGEFIGDLMAVSDVSGWWFGTWMFFSISLIYSDMGCHHPSHWRTPSFFKMIIAPPTRCFLMLIWILLKDLFGDFMVIWCFCRAILYGDLIENPYLTMKIGTKVTKNRYIWHCQKVWETLVFKDGRFARFSWLS